MWVCIIHSMFLLVVFWVCSALLRSFKESGWSTIFIKISNRRKVQKRPNMDVFSMGLITKKHFGNTEIRLVEDDITEMETDAIVNAANSRLAHGGGVAGAIVRKGGLSIQEESETWIMDRGEVVVGSAAITSAGELPSKYVIHAVGPRMGEGDEDEKLKSATLSALQMSDKHSLKSIAFPAVSTGIFGYPLDRCAQVMLSTVLEYVKEKTSLEKIVFCLWGEESMKVFKKTLNQLSDSKFG